MVEHILGLEALRPHRAQKQLSNSMHLQHFQVLFQVLSASFALLSHRAALHVHGPQQPAHRIHDSKGSQNYLDTALDGQDSHELKLLRQCCLRSIAESSANMRTMRAALF